MFIHDKKVSKFELFSTKYPASLEDQEEGIHIKNKKVGEMRYYGTYQGGGYRYYIGGVYGSNQNPIQLRDDLDSEQGLLVGAGKCYYINAIRRLGYYR